MDDQTTNTSRAADSSDHAATGAETSATGKTVASQKSAAGISAGRLVVYAAVIALVGAVALGVLFSSGDDSSPEASTAGFDRFEGLVFATVDGETSNLGDFAGQPLVVNFFASWCAPCRAEIPHFESANEANGDRVKFLGINHDIDDSSWKAFVAETGVTFETVFQPGTEIWNEIDAKGMPTTAFVSADGEVLYVYTGILDEPTLQSLIDEHLLENA